MEGEEANRGRGCPQGHAHDRHQTHVPGAVEGGARVTEEVGDRDITGIGDAQDDDEDCGDREQDPKDQTAQRGHALGLGSALRHETSQFHDQTKSRPVRLKTCFLGYWHRTRYVAYLELPVMVPRALTEIDGA